MDSVYSKITPNDILDFSSELPATEISKIYKLYDFINKENINIDKLINTTKRNVSYSS